LAILALALIRRRRSRRALAIRSRKSNPRPGVETFDPREPGRTRFGALAFRGGLVLESSYRDFGGLSSMRVAPDGEHFLAVTDKGIGCAGGSSIAARSRLRSPTPRWRRSSGRTAGR
jgi:hypothetical protein